MPDAYLIVWLVTMGPAANENETNPGLNCGIYNSRLYKLNNLFHAHDTIPSILNYMNSAMT